MTQIANPIYDVVFKYLMEDNRVAKLFLSILTGLDIVKLEFKPQELSVDKNESKTAKRSILSSLNLSIYRLDFTALVKLKDGSTKLIIIEIQKSKYTLESMRFRKYLGKQYMNESFFKWMITANDKQYKIGLPILPIFLLGERIEGFENIPVLHISKQIKDRYTNEVLDQKNDFIDSLFHEGIIVNIPALSKKRRDELETLLSIFDQSQRSENFHIMNVVETDFPEKFRPIIRRLQNAAIDKELRDVMIIEDDFLSEINDIENQIVTERKAKEEAVRKQEEAVRMLINAGIPKTIIATQLGMSIEEVEKINT